jgi:hypothetical protein
MLSAIANAIAMIGPLSPVRLLGRLRRSLVITRGTPPHSEGCQPASRGSALAFATVSNTSSGLSPENPRIPYLTVGPASAMP